jgi:hypothetical protein
MTQLAADPPCDAGKRVRLRAAATPLDLANSGASGTRTAPHGLLRLANRSGQ